MTCQVRAACNLTVADLALELLVIRVRLQVHLEGTSAGKALSALGALR